MGVPGASDENPHVLGPSVQVFHGHSVTELALVAIAAHLVVRELVAHQGAMVRASHGVLRDGCTAAEAHGPHAAWARHGDEVELLHIERRLRKWPPQGPGVHVATRVGSAEAEGGAASIATVQAPFTNLRLEDPRVALHVHVGVQLPEVNVRWHAGVQKAQYQSEHPGDTRTGLQVADVGLGRGVEQREFALLDDDCRDGAHLDGIAERGARAMALREAEVVRLQATKAHAVLEHGLLRRPAGGCEAGTLAVVAGDGAHNAGQTVVELLLVLAELHERSRTALAPLVAVGRLIKGEAAPGVGEDVALAIANVARHADGVRACYHGSVAFNTPLVEVEHGHVRMVGGVEGR
mmetsp:Transcript_79671/g.258077  ORF Transcript_79671/g.258077 Transcript_79671/m.258077 type:complete len:350 (-) Transcript_79671:1003-2052(-)